MQSRLPSQHELDAIVRALAELDGVDPDDLVPCDIERHDYRLGDVTECVVRRYRDVPAVQAEALRMFRVWRVLRAVGI